MPKLIYFNTRVPLLTEDNAQKALTLFHNPEEGFMQQSFLVSQRDDEKTSVRVSALGVKPELIAMFFLKLAQSCRLVRRIGFLYQVDLTTLDEGGIFLFDGLVRGVAFIKVDDFLERGMLDFNPTWDYTFNGETFDAQA